MIRIVERTALSDSQLADVLALMRELDPGIPVTGEWVKRAVEAPGTHFFAAMETDGPEAGRVVGCASLCVFDSPTGRKAGIEDVVVSPACRGQGIGRALMEEIIGFARRELAPVDLHLTSRPSRVAANRLYQALGFRLRETNAYRMTITKDCV